MTQSNVTQLLHAIEAGEDRATSELLAIVYQELRTLAAQHLRRERSGQTLQATALVHEAYLRLVGPDAETEPRWEGRGHFFAAAAEAMRRIMIDRARARGAQKRGGDARRLTLDPASLTMDDVPAGVAELGEALARFEAQEPEKAMLVKLRFFGGLTFAQAAAVLGISSSTADRHWAYAKAWLYNDLSLDD